MANLAEMGAPDTAMSKDREIEISQVANGYIVRPMTGYWFNGDMPQRYTWAGSRQDYFVFRSLAELLSWVEDHFTHRQKNAIQRDPS